MKNTTELVRALLQEWNILSVVEYTIPIIIPINSIINVNNIKHYKSTQKNVLYLQKKWLHDIN